MSATKHNPALDEQTFARLLEAAYVVQEHNRELQALGRHVEYQDTPGEQAPPTDASTREKPAPPTSENGGKADYTLILGQIVETQHQIQVRHLELDNALAMVAERLTEITGAAGAAAGIVDGETIRYKATSGARTLPPGTEIPLERSLSGECVRSGLVVRCPDVNSEFPAGARDCQRHGIRALIAVPVFHAGGIAGVLELYYAAKNAFTEQDVHTCQLMAGLITEALARHEEIAWKKSLASERAVMLEALEKLKPNLAALVDTPAGERSAKLGIQSTAAPGSASVCRKCGHELVADEPFCGNCGSPRNEDNERSGMRSEAAPLPQIQQVLKADAHAAPANGSSAQPEPRLKFDEHLPEKPLAESLEEEMPELFALPEFQTGKAAEPATVPEALTDAAEPNLAAPIEAASEAGEEIVDEAPEQETSEEEDGSPTAVAKRPEPAAHWSSAAAARDFLEEIAATKAPTGLLRFWNARRGDFYLAIAVILVACVVRWGIWSSHSAAPASHPATAAATHRRPDPAADLSLFDRMLISLGLAEAPEPVEYKGNPDTKVWVDLQTALYYCPGADLYGKTLKGKITTQRDAQLDQFEPAYQKACD